MRKVSIQWHLRRLMAEQGWYATTELVPLLEARGVSLPATQVYRQVTQTPERLNVQVLAALCDASGCSPADLIGVQVAPTTRRRAATGRSAPGVDDREGPVGPTRVKLVDD